MLNCMGGVVESMCAGHVRRFTSSVCHCKEHSVVGSDVYIL